MASASTRHGGLAVPSCGKPGGRLGQASPKLHPEASQPGLLLGEGKFAWYHLTGPFHSDRDTMGDVAKNNEDYVTTKPTVYE